MQGFIQVPDCYIFVAELHWPMNTSFIFENLISPPILFFFLGLLARWIKSDLEFPPAISKFLSLYLLFAIGLKGGTELAHSGLSSEVLLALGLAMILAIIVPFYSFYLLRTKFDIYNAGALAATYGSISAVTFVTAVAFLQAMNQEYGGFMVAAMALMESPALIIGVILIRFYDTNNKNGNLGEVVKEAFTNASVVLILGALIIGALVSPAQMKSIEPFTKELFTGILTFFLLDMGLLAGKRINGLRQAGWMVIVFGILAPLFNAAMALVLGIMGNLSAGNVFLLMVLGASASYIAVPAALRMAVPQANAGIYVSMSLAVPFPFNIVLGVPIYYYLLMQMN